MSCSSHRAAALQLQPSSSIRRCSSIRTQAAADVDVAAAADQQQQQEAPAAKKQKQQKQGGKQQQQQGGGEGVCARAVWPWCMTDHAEGMQCDCANA